MFKIKPTWPLLAAPVAFAAILATAGVSAQDGGGNSPFSQAAETSQAQGMLAMISPDPVPRDTEEDLDAHRNAVDTIELVKTGDPVGPSPDDPVIPLKKRALERRLGDRESLRVHVLKRFDIRLAQEVIGSDTEALGDQAFLRRIARDTWRGLEAMTDRNNGLPVDNVQFDGKVVIGDYTNITNVGLYMMSVVGAMELGFIDRTDAKRRLTVLLETLDRLETHNGFFFNYYDTTSLERTSNLISFVDSSWLTAGLMVVRGAFPDLGATATRFIERMDFAWLYDDKEQLMSHGYYVNMGDRSQFNYGMLYTETRTGSLIAIGKGDVPADHWYRMFRTFPKDWRWQTQAPAGRTARVIDGHTVQGGWYEWNGTRYVPSWGGSMFEALMPTLVVNEKHFAPHSLGMNNEQHVRIQQQYATEVLGYPVWGLSPSATPMGSEYSEFGIKPLGARGYAIGTVTPHATLLAMNIAPESAIQNLRELIKRYPVYTEYGFYDAVDPVSGDVNPRVLLLDHAMSFVSLVNYLDDRAIQRYFAADPIAAAALPILGQERFFD